MLSTEDDNTLLDLHNSSCESRMQEFLMHMSSACLGDRTLGEPGEYVGEYKGMD